MHFIKQAGQVKRVTREDVRTAVHLFSTERKTTVALGAPAGGRVAPRSATDVVHCYN